MKLTSSLDRGAVGHWIEGQVDRAEGRRILAALPRLRHGEGWVWAPWDGVLARMAFPRIRTFDSSATPRREERAAAPGGLTIGNLPAIRAALSGTGAETGNRSRVAASAERSHAADLKRQLRQRDADLEATRAHLARLRAEAAKMRMRLDQASTLDGMAAPFT